MTRLFSIALAPIALAPIALTMITGLAFSIPFLTASPLRAHQSQTVQENDVSVMIHLNPNDSPYAGKSTETWFMLMRPNGEMIAPTTCNCQVKVYNWRKIAIDSNPVLTTMQAPGHEAGHKVFRTAITFPKSGAYTVVLSGKAKDKSFKPFAIKFPVTVRP
jgi:hypothetical protein